VTGVRKFNYTHHSSVSYTFTSCPSINVSSSSVWIGQCQPAYMADDFACGSESKTTLCYVEFARWRHRGRSLLSSTALLLLFSNNMYSLCTCIAFVTVLPWAKQSIAIALHLCLSMFHATITCATGFILLKWVHAVCVKKKKIPIYSFSISCKGFWENTFPHMIVLYVCFCAQLGAVAPVVQISITLRL